MIGNAYEPVQDWYAYPYEVRGGERTDPTGPAKSTGYRTLRGGSFHHDLRRYGQRFFVNPSEALPSLGLRIVRDAR